MKPYQTDVPDPMCRATQGIHGARPADVAREARGRLQDQTLQGLGKAAAIQHEGIDGGVLYETELLGKVLCGIEEAIDALEKTLTPILQSDDKLNPGDIDQTYPSTPLAAGIRSCRERAQRYAATLMRMNSRVGL